MLVAPRRVQAAVQLARLSQVQWCSLSTSAAALADDKSDPQSKLRAMLNMPAARARRAPAAAADASGTAASPAQRRTPDASRKAPSARKFIFNKDGVQSGESTTNQRDPNRFRREGERRDFRPRDGQRRDFKPRDGQRDGQRRDFKPRDGQRDGQRRDFQPRDGQRDGPRREFKSRDGQPRRDNRSRDGGPARAPARVQADRQLPPEKRAELADSPELAEVGVDAETAQDEGAAILDFDEPTDNVKMARAEKVGRKLQKRRQLRSAETASEHAKARKGASEEDILAEGPRAKPQTHVRTSPTLRALDDVSDAIDPVEGEVDELQGEQQDDDVERALLSRKVVSAVSHTPKGGRQPAEQNAIAMAEVAVDQGEKGYYQLLNPWPRPGEYHSKLRLEHAQTKWDDPYLQEPRNIYNSRQKLMHKMVGAPVVPHFTNGKSYKYDGPTYSSAVPEQKKGKPLEKDYASPEAMRPFVIPTDLSMKFALYHYQTAMPQGLASVEPKLARPRYMDLTEEKPNVSKGSTPTYSDNPEPVGERQWVDVAKSLNQTHASTQEARVADLEGVDPKLMQKAFPTSTIWRAAEVKRRELLAVKGGDYSQYVVKPLTLAQFGLDPKDPEQKQKLSSGQRALHNARSALAHNPGITLDGKEYAAKAIQSRVAEIP